MPFSILIYVTRKPSLTPEEFKDYWENHHIPLLQSLTGDSFPRQHRRKYLARTARKGFGGPANKDNPLLVLRGSPEDFDFDGMAELTWDDEAAFHKFYNAIYSKEAAAKLARDEEVFLEPGKLKAVVVDDSRNT